MRGLLSGACAAAVAVASAPASADEGHSALEVQFERSSSPPPSSVLALTGLTLFGFAYNDSIFVAILSDRGSDKRLYIPVVGPWLSLAQRDCAARPCSVEGLSEALFIVDGVSQGLGVGLMLASLFVPDRPMDVRVGTARVRLTPASLARGAFGMQALGTF